MGSGARAGRAPQESEGSAKRPRRGLERGALGRHEGRVAEERERRPRAAPGWGKAQILAVGHSTRPSEDLVELLQAAGVTMLASAAKNLLM